MITSLELITLDWPKYDAHFNYAKEVTLPTLPPSESGDRKDAVESKMNDGLLSAVYSIRRCFSLDIYLFHNTHCFRVVEINDSQNS